MRKEKEREQPTAHVPLSVNSQADQCVLLPQMLRRGLVLDLAVASGLGTSAGYLWWYGTLTPTLELMFSPWPYISILPFTLFVPLFNTLIKT